MPYKYCPECGTALNPAMKFCPGCGKVLISDVSNNSASSPVKKEGTLTILHDSYWILMDSKYEFLYNGLHYSDFSFKTPFRYDLPLVQVDVKIKVKKMFLSWTFSFLVDPHKNYIDRLTYDRISRQFNLVVKDENNKQVYKDTLF